MPSRGTSPASPAGRRWRLAARLAGAGLSAGLLAACAVVPSGGEPHAVTERDGSQAPNLYRNYVRFQAPSPKQGWDAATIIVGFQVALADFTGGHAVARRYLTPALARSWDPNVRTVVYADLQPSTPAESPSWIFDYKVTPIAVVGRDHGFALDDAEESWSAQASLQHDGEWRLSDIEPGTLLSIADFEQAFRPVDVYFPAASNPVLVPDHVFLPVVPTDLPTAMVRQLVQGPTSWLSSAVSPVVPAGTVVRSVVVDADGTARVVLGGAARQLTASQRRPLLAALAWTLVGQLPDVKSVQLSIDGVVADDLAVAHQLQEFSSYDPGAYPSGSPATYVDGGRVLQLTGSPGDSPSPAAQPDLAGAIDPVTPVAARELAAIRRGKHGDALVLYDYDEARWRTAYRAKELSAPTWIADGSAVWTIATRADGSQQVVAVPVSPTNGSGSTKPVRVAVHLGASGLRLVGHLTQLRLARDGTRVAFIRADPRGSLASARPYVARIDRTGAGLALSALRPLAPACPSQGSQRCLTATTDIAWADADHLVVLANTNATDPDTRAPYLVSVDGSSVVPVGTAGLSSDVESITAAPGVPMVAVVPGVGHAEPTLYALKDDGWVRVTHGYGARYPD